MMGVDLREFSSVGPSNGDIPLDNTLWLIFQNSFIDPFLYSTFLHFLGKCREDVGIFSQKHL